MLRIHNHPTTTLSKLMMAIMMLSLLALLFATTAVAFVFPTTGSAKQRAAAAPPPGSSGLTRMMMAAASTKKQPQRGNDSIVYGIGLGWEEHWENMYQQLVAELSFHNSNGKDEEESSSSSFKLGYAENTRLWLWLHIQKENLRRGVMRNDRKQKLAALGFRVDAEVKYNDSNNAGTFEEQLMFAPTPPPVTTSTSTSTKKWLQEEFVFEHQFAPKPPPVTYHQQQHQQH